MPTFTPVSSALGGALIGAAASLLLVLNGKVAGISGIFSGVIRTSGDERRWKALFLAGLVTAGAIFVGLDPTTVGSAPPIPLGLLVVGGLLVGGGTEVGSGCTSGHGVCGISRGSKRSIAATMTFMGAGLATVYALRHLLGVAQ